MAYRQPVQRRSYRCVFGMASSDRPYAVAKDTDMRRTSREFQEQEAQMMDDEAMRKTKPTQSGPDAKISKIRLGRKNTVPPEQVRRCI